jgi:hypothetical protein
MAVNLSILNRTVQQHPPFSAWGVPTPYGLKFETWIWAHAEVTCGRESCSETNYHQAVRSPLNAFNETRC